MTNSLSIRVAFVYDRINKFGGAERVLQILHEIWPEAPLYTSVYDPDGAPWVRNSSRASARDFEIRTSFLQKFPWARRNHESLGWLMPAAFESLDLSEFDVVISVTSEAAKGIITTPRQLHICYLLTPTRYLWSHARKYLILSPRFLRPAAFVAQLALRQWDFLAAQRPDHFVAVSEHVRRRCEKYYRREASVIYPPVMLQGPKVPEVSKVQQRGHSGASPRAIESTGSYRSRRSLQDDRPYLVVSRLVPYKRIELAIEVCIQIREPLVVIGSGRERKRLERLVRLRLGDSASAFGSTKSAFGQTRSARQAGPTVRFVENVSDEELVEYYRGARAVLMPQEEDFGLVALEAQACGTPVVTYGQSGAAEVVIDGKTGVFFDHQTVDDLAHAIRRCPPGGEACTIQANRFSKTEFQKDFREMVEELWNSHVSFRA